MKHCRFAQKYSSISSSDIFRYIKSTLCNKNNITFTKKYLLEYQQTSVCNHHSHFVIQCVPFTYWTMDEIIAGGLWGVVPFPTRLVLSSWMSPGTGTCWHPQRSRTDDQQGTCLGSEADVERGRFQLLEIVSTTQRHTVTLRGKIMLAVKEMNPVRFKYPASGGHADAAVPLQACSRLAVGPKQLEPTSRAAHWWEMNFYSFSNLLHLSYNMPTAFFLFSRDMWFWCDTSEGFVVTFYWPHHKEQLCIDPKRWIILAGK